MKFAFDFDGVFADHTDVKVEICRQLLGVDPPLPKGTVLAGNALNLEEYLKVQRTVYPTREANLRMDPVEGALEFSEKLLENGHTLHIVTSRTGEELALAKEWAKRHNIPLGLTGVPYDKSKAEAARGFHGYADDDLYKLRLLVGFVPYLFLFTWWYNEHEEVPDPIRRVSSWEELYYYVEVMDRFGNGKSK